MPALPRLRHDPDDPKHLLHCSNPECWEKRAKLLMATTRLTPVDLELAASEMIMVVMPDGYTRWDFKVKGDVESLSCSNCGAQFYPISAYDPA